MQIYEKKKPYIKPNQKKIVYFCSYNLKTNHKQRINQMDVIKEIIRRAQQQKQRIVLPEGTEPRTFKQLTAPCKTA